MKSLDHNYRLGGGSFSVPEIKECQDRTLIDLNQRLRYGGHVIRAAHLLNALMLYFCELPDDVRIALADRALARLEIVMADG